MLLELPLVEPVLGVLEDGLAGVAGVVGLVVLAPEPALPVLLPVPPLIPELLLPLLLPCCFWQSVFAAPLRPSQRLLLEPLVLLLELGLEVLGLDVLLLELGLEVLGLELELPDVCATDTMANPASAAAMAMPSAFFIMNGLLRRWGKVLRAPSSKRRAAPRFHG